MRHITASAFRPALLALCLAVLGAPVAWSAGPAQLQPPRPLFDPGAGVFFSPPVSMTGLAFAASTSHQARALGIIATLYAGELDRYSAWTLEGPMGGRDNRVLIGTTTAVLNGFSRNPFTALATLRAGDHVSCWTLRDTDIFHKLPRAWLESARDGQPILEGDPESEDYARILTLANFTSNAAFRRNSRRDVTATHLASDAAFYRGQVLFIEGHLRRINRYRPPPEAAREGVNDLFEAWIFPDHMGAQAFCCVFTEWPAGLSRDLLGVPKIKHGVRVQFAGYFYKQFGFQGGARNKVQAPLLIGHTLTLHTTPVARPADALWFKPVLYAVPAMLVALIFAVVGMTYWFRRTDRLLLERLRKAQDREFVPPAPDALPVAAPLAASPPRAVPARASFPARMNLPGRGDRGGDSPSHGEGPSESGDKPPDDVTGV